MHRSCTEVPKSLTKCRIDMTIEALEVKGSQEQGSMAWKVARLGNFTASNIADLMSKGRSKESVWGDTAISLMAEKAAERKLNMTLLSDEEKYNEFADLQCRENGAMRHGKHYEHIARDYYEIDNGVSVQECGLLMSKECPTLAASPDGVICNARGTIVGAIEIKCPASIKTFQRYLWNIVDASTLKEENKTYYWQVMTVMAVTGARYCDFIVYCPWMFEGKEMKVVRIERNEDDCEAIKERVKLANEFIDEREQTLYGKKENKEFVFPDDLEENQNA